MPLLLLGGISAALLTLLLLEKENAEKPSPPQAPYTPPFTGGQCQKVYLVAMRFDLKWRQSDRTQINSLTIGVYGPIRGIRVDADYVRLLAHNQNGLPSETNAVASFGNYQGDYDVVSASITSVTTSDGLPDECGDIPNPNPPLDTIPNGGYGSPPPNVIGDDYEPQLLLAPVLPVGGALAAAIAALNAAKAAIALATSIAELANALKDFFDKQDEYEEEKEKEKEKEEEKKKKKEIWRQSLGTIRNDGILSLVPKDTNESIRLLFLEINFVNIPNSIGKYFGEYSPNRYPYEYGLGYIGFYGAGAGIRELHNMEFRRNSIRIPSDTLGFIYHLGLNTSTSANVDLIYEREVNA